MKKKMPNILKKQPDIWENVKYSLKKSHIYRNTVKRDKKSQIFC